MRHLGMAFIIGITLTPGSALAAAPYHAEVNGAAAQFDFDHVSEVGGCTVEISGTVAAVQTRTGSGPGFGAILVGFVTSSCGGGYPIGGAADAELASSGLSRAHYAGSFTASDLSGEGNPDVTVRLDVTWTGQGAVSHEGATSHSSAGGATIFYSFQNSRAATVSGSIEIGGATVSPDETSNAFLASAAAGEIEVVP